MSDLISNEVSNQGPSTQDFWIDCYRPYFLNRKILIGITGSIAAFKTIDVIRLLKKCGAEVRVMVTPSALNFVTRATIETISENAMSESMWEGGDQSSMQHIDLARWADAILIAPASANTIAKLANGIADNLLTTEVLAAKCPVWLAPAMNPTMLSHPATQENLKKIKSWGYRLLGPNEGLTACGDAGSGRMVEAIDMVETIATQFTATNRNQTVLISMGPTRSYLDPVRYFTNRSSGKMGASLAFAADRAGFTVEVVAGESGQSIPLPRNALVTRVTSTQAMAATVFEKAEHCDVFISTAAVLDFEFEVTSTEKLKKQEALTRIGFSETPDILKTVCKSNPRPKFVLGFAAETTALEENAKKKLDAKSCDAIFVNPVTDHHAGFESNTNRGTWISRRQNKKFMTQSKGLLAEQILKTLIDENSE